VDLTHDAAVQAASRALVERHLVLPDLAEVVATVAVEAACPALWAALRRRLERLEAELGLPPG
jgi:hypothetical protein